MPNKTIANKFHSFEIYSPFIMLLLMLLFISETYGNLDDGGPVLNLNLTAPENYDGIVSKAKHEPVKLILEDNDEAGMGRGGTSDERLRWASYRMPIVLDSEYNDSERKTILSALFTLSKAMECFEFNVVKRGQTLSENKDHLFIKKGNACGSSLGRVGRKQITQLGINCNLFGTTMHEVMHVLGFYHEHVRPDRDQYVIVHWDKLPSSKFEHQYKIRDNQILFADNYDFESIMHYPFSEQMSPKPGKVPKGVKVGQRDHLSPTDIKRLHGMYPCK